MKRRIGWLRGALAAGAVLGAWFGGGPALEAQDAVLRVGFVDVNSVTARVEGTTEAIDALQDQLDQVVDALNDLEAQRAAGSIGQAAYAVRREELEGALNLVDQQLQAAIDAEVAAAAAQVGAELGLDLITPLRNVVAHGQSAVLQNLTEPVLAQLNANLGGAPFDASGVERTAQPLRRVGFVNVDEAFLRYLGTAVAIQQIRDKQLEVEAEIERLEDQLSAGLISNAAFNARVAALNAELEALNQQLTNGVLQEISGAVSRLGTARDYNLITTKKNVVLHADPEANLDLTPHLIALMNAEYDDVPFDFAAVPLPARAPARVGFVDADSVFVRFEGTGEAIERFRRQIEEANRELAELQARLEAGEIDDATFLERRNALTIQLTQLDQLLTREISARISEAVDALGAERGFDLVTSRKSTVLYHNPDTVTDLTEPVLARMNETP